MRGVNLRVKHHLVILNTILPQVRVIMCNAHGYRLTNEADVLFMEGEKVIFNEDQASLLVQVNGDIGVIVNVFLDPDERSESQYMVVCLYRNCKVVRDFEIDITSDVQHRCITWFSKKKRY